MLTLEQSTSLAVAVLHQVSSRVRAKCQPAAASLRVSCTQMLSLAVHALENSPAATGTAVLNKARSVDVVVVQALQQCSLSLLTPVVFGNAKEIDSLGAELGTVLNAMFSPRSSDNSVNPNFHARLQSLVLAALCAVSSQFDVSAAANALHRSLCVKV